MISQVLILMLLSVIIQQGDGLQSVWKVRIDQKRSHLYNIFPNYMFKDSYTSMNILCYAKEPVELTIRWTFRQVRCMEQMFEANLHGLDISSLERQAQSKQRKLPRSLSKSLNGMQNFTQPEMTTQPLPSITNNTDADTTESTESRARDLPVAFQMSPSTKYICHDHNIIEPVDESKHPYRRVTFSEDPEMPRVETIQRPEEDGEDVRQRVVSAWEDGMYHFELVILPTSDNDSFQAIVTVEMHGGYGYLTAIDWPLLPYNGVMSFLYLVLSTVWIMTWARSHRFTLRIHVGMGLIAVAGAMSHTLVFVQHSAENSNGGGAALIMWFAQVLSCAQMAFLNFILMIVSTGYGIVLPTLPRRMLFLMGLVCSFQFALGISWLVFTDSELKLQYVYPVLTKTTLWCKVAIFVTIAAEIMLSAIRTLIHLRSRPDAGVKILIFTIFMISCIFTFIVHMVVFVLGMGWMQACRTNWQIQWVFNSITHMEAFVLLIILMILWRPVDTAQSYAFAPLGMEGLADSQDEEEEEEEEELEVFSKETDKFDIDEL